MQSSPRPGESLPVDSDVEVESRTSSSPRPLHLSPASLGIVAAGGTLGTAAREALSLAIPDLGALPFGVLVINIAGALVLGLLLESLARRGPDQGTRRLLRLLLGTGFLGGFTTYSALATGAAQLLGGQQMAVGAVYALSTVVLGALGTWAGLILAGAHHRRSVEATR